MASPIRISDELVSKAKIRGKALRRSAAGQIEYWALIGEIAEDNPDLNFAAIQSIMIGLEEARNGQVEPFIFSEQ